MNVLLIGGGGREHALAWKLSESVKVGQIYVSPGNGGVETIEKAKCCEIKLPKSNAENYDCLIDFCQKNNIKLVVVGPEEHLDRSIANSLADYGIPCFGPNVEAAKIESSKAFAKNFMTCHFIPTARYETFTSSIAAKKHINSAPYKALVIKASGLAAGKGVVVAKNVEEACSAVEDMLDKKIFKEAGSEIVVEELLEGDEISALAFTDGTNVRLMPLAQDHKRLLDNDLGPNTGGMGAYAPCLTNPSTLEFVENILKVTVEKLKLDGRIFKGVIYAGIMITDSGPRVLEYNCRFGDPETQAILPLLKTDLFDILLSCTDGTLNEQSIEWYANLTACGTVMASGGYPDVYETGFEIQGLEKVEETSKKNVRVFHAGTKKTDNKFFTSGGRVLCVTGLGENLTDARRQAETALGLISFQNCHFRRDIGLKPLNTFSTAHLTSGIPNGGGLTYTLSGVDITAGDSLVQNIKQYCAGTRRTGSSLFEFGGFGGLFDLKEAGYDDPILVSGTDGVGTKLKIAQSIGYHQTVGIDLVAMCVNDVLVHNAEPLFFLDYFATGKLDVAATVEVIAGVAEGCRQANCILIGGETAEMPGFYTSSEYDLAGFAVGALNRSDVRLPKIENIKVGDVVFGLASSGLHSNGFSMVRKIVTDFAGLSYTCSCPWNPSTTIGKELLTPTKIYVKTLLPLLRRRGLINAAAHITGGGLLENIPRVLPDHLAVQLDANSWTVPEVFKWLARTGRVDPTEMVRTFNCGLGMALIVPADRVDEISQSLKNLNEISFRIGSVVSKNDIGGCSVDIKNLQNVFPPVSHPTVPEVRVGVLISGTGTNLQSLIDYTKNDANNSRCSIAVVISNVDGVQGLARAKKANIPTEVVSHKGKSRESFDEEIHKILCHYNIRLVCLAGFMRILSETFVQKWRGRMLNVHPSLLPSFKGAHAHELVLASGVRLSGCTVHFVEPEVDAGGIVLQESVFVHPTDTVETLSERVKQAEHRIYPKALELVARSHAVLDQTNNKVVWSENAFAQL